MEDLPRSKSVPSNLTVGRSDRASITSSGSYQSHLSTGGHLHRVRTTSGQISLTFLVDQKSHIHTLENGLPGQSRCGRLSPAKQLVADPAGFLSDDLRRIRSGHTWRLRSLVTLYCCISIVFFTIRFHALSRLVLQSTLSQHPESRIYTLDRPAAESQSKESPTLMNITISQRIPVTFRGLPPQAHLDTFVIQAHPGYESDLTACLWIEDSHIKHTLSSITAWPGPVSLMVVTTHAPNSTEYKKLQDSLATTFVSESTSVHILCVPSISGVSSNVYLNIVRFFARTSKVVLFPNGIPKPVTSTHASWINGLPTNISRPVILSNATYRAFSSRPLAPVALPRDHPVWCAERFYLFGSRLLDWEDCLWQMWLESGGEISSIIVPLVDDPGNMTIPSVSPHAVRLIQFALFSRVHCLVGQDSASLELKVQTGGMCVLLEEITGARLLLKARKKAYAMEEEVLSRGSRVYVLYRGGSDLTTPVRLWDLRLMYLSPD